MDGLGWKAENRGACHAKTHSKLPAVIHGLPQSAFHSFDTLFTHSSSRLNWPRSTNSATELRQALLSFAGASENSINVLKIFLW